MASPVKREPPDAENDQLFGMNDPSPFLHDDTERREESVDPWMNVKLEDNDPFGVEALLNAPVDDYKMEEEEEYDMRLNGDLALDQSNYLMLMDDGEEMRERNEAGTNFTDPLGANLSMTDKDSAQDSHVNWVNPRLPRGNFVPPGCTLFGIGAPPPQTEPTPDNEPPIDNIIEKEPPANLYDAIKKKTRRQSAKVIEEKENTVVEKRGRKSTVAKKVAGARRSIPRNAKKTVEPGQDVAVPKGRRGRPKGSKTKPVDPPVLSPMDNGNASMGNGIIDSSLVRRRPRMVGGTGNAAVASAAEHSSDPLSSLHPWNGSIQASHPFHHSFDNSPIDRSYSTTVSHSYTGGRTTVSQWGVHSTTVSRSASNINPIADHNYSVSVSKKRAADARMAKRGSVAPARPRQTAMVRLAPPKPPHCPPPIDIPNGGGVMVVDPRMERRDTEGEEEMGRAREQQQMDTAMAFYDPRRVQRKSIQSDFVPHPLDEGEMFRVVCGPIPEKEVSLDVIRERVLSLCRPFDYKFTRFEGSYYMWLRFTVEQETYDLFRSKPIRLGLFSTAFYKPGTLTVDTNGPMGDYYLLIILSKYGTVAGVEKIGEFKWKATYLEDTEATTVVNLRGETVGQASLAYSPYVPTHRSEMESPASPPYESEDVADPSNNVPAQAVLPILPAHRSSPIHIPTDKEDPYVYDQLLPAGTDAQSYHATQTPATEYGDYPTGGAMMVPYVRPILAPAGARTKGQHFTGALVPRAAGTIAAQPPHSGGYRVQPYEGHMAHLVPAAAAAPGGGVRLPTTAQRGGMVMVRSTIENAVERMRRRGEGLADFPLIDADDVKECVVGMRAWTNNIVLGPMPSVYDEDEMRRVYQIHHEIGLRMIGDFMHLFIAADASHEAKLHLWRIQNENCTGGVMTNIAKGIPRSIIVEATSIYSTAQTVSDYFERQFGRVVSVNEQHERSAKIFAVNFMHRKEAASAFNTRIHFAYVNGEAFVLCEVLPNIVAAVGMDSDDASECSIELGMDYERIEYPKEVYDTICGRSASVQPLAKKQKVDDWLTTSQSSQDSSQLSQVSSVSEIESSSKSKKKQKQNAYRKKTAEEASKSVNTRRSKKDVNKVKGNEICSDEESAEEEEWRDASSQASSETPKKKKEKQLHVKSAGKSSKSGKIEKKSAKKIVERKIMLRGGRNVTIKREDVSEESSETGSEGEEEEESLDDGSEMETSDHDNSKNSQSSSRSVGKTMKSTKSEKTRAKKMDRTSLKVHGRKRQVRDYKDEDYREESDEEEDTMDSPPEKKKSKDKSVRKDTVKVEKTEEKVKGRSTNEKGKDEKVKRDSNGHGNMKKDEKRSSIDKTKEGKAKYDSKDARVRKESHSNGGEKKERKEKDVKRMKEPVEAKDSSAKERRKSNDSTQVVLPKVKHPEKRSSETTVLATPQSSVVRLNNNEQVHSTVKPILKKKAPATVSPSDNSVLPSCMQELFSDLPPPPPTNFSLDGYRVPKKKDKIEDRLTQRLGLPLTSPLAESPVQIEGSNGYNPRDDAFRPPQRNFGKPSLLKSPVGVERRQHDIHRRPEDKSSSGIASAFYRPSLFQREEDTNNEENELDDDDIDLQAIPIGAPPSIPLIPPTSPPRRKNDDEDEEEEDEELKEYQRMMEAQARSPVYFASTPSPPCPEYKGYEERRERSSFSMERDRSMQRRGDGRREERSPPSYKYEPGSKKRWDWDEERKRGDDRRARERHEVQNSSSSSSFSTTRCSSNSSLNFVDNFLDSSRDRNDSVKRNDFPRAPNRPSFREQELAEVRRREDERRNDEEKWREAKRRIKKEEEEREEEYWRMNTPLSPPPSASSSFNRRSSLDEEYRPTHIPADQLVRYRLIPIDDECLPPRMRSENFPLVAPAAYTPCAPKCHTLLVAGPFPERVSKANFEKKMKDKGADVQWTVAPATKDPHAMSHRSMAAVICYSEETAKGLLAKHNIMIDQTYVEVGKPGEVLVSIEGFTDKVDQEELTMEITDTVETHWGHLIELLLTVDQEALTVHGKARFFYAIHASRASCAAPIPLSGGRLLSFSPCPPEKSTKWIAGVDSDSADEPRPSATVPAPDTPPTTVSKSAESQVSAPSGTTAPLAGSQTSRFAALCPLMAIPPPGLIDPGQLKYMIKREEPDDYERTLSIPPISVPASLIPLPPPPAVPIPPPLDIRPILPYPDLPIMDRVFFQPHPPSRVVSKSGTRDRRMGGKDGNGKSSFKDEILLFARPLNGEQPPDWDVVRQYFKDEDCSSLVYGGIVSLRFTGPRAKEKAQVLLCKESPHDVNGQQFEVGMTFSVLFEATSAVRKIGVYDEVKQKFGSVVEVEKKCNALNGKPVYKIYFDSLDTAKQAGLEGFTAEGSTFTNIGLIPE